MESKLITFIGAPSSGKSTLASSVHSELKKLGLNSIFVSEAATDFIAEWGIPNDPQDQLVIFYEQTNRERIWIGSKEFIVCDSSGILNYFYFRTLFPQKLETKDVAIINHLQKQILKTINQWTYIFYVPPILDNIDDGIRYQNVDEIKKLDRWMKSYLELENISHIDLSKVNLHDRCRFVTDLILNNKIKLND